VKLFVSGTAIVRIWPGNTDVIKY